LSTCAAFACCLRAGRGVDEAQVVLFYVHGELLLMLGLAAD
jgi:hypothetical protein